MPPALALGLCIAFSAALLVLDAQQRRNVSAQLWIPLIWLMIIASRPVAQWFMQGSSMSEDAFLHGSPIDRAVLSTLMLCGILSLLSREIAWRNVVRSNLFVISWFVLCGLSILWSEYQGVALRRWFKSLGMIVMVLVVITERDPFEAIQTIFRRCAYVLIPLSIVLIKYYRDLGVGYTPWGGGPYYLGVTNNKNTLGRLCLTCGFVLFVGLWEQRRRGDGSMFTRATAPDMLLIAMILWLLLKADSATALACLIAGITVYTAAGLPFVRRNLHRLGSMTLLAVVVLVALQAGFDIKAMIVTSLGRDSTLTGRSVLYGDLLGLVSSPLVGVGYDSFWLGERLNYLWDKYWWQPNEAHNGYLETYLELGVLGLTVLLMILLKAYRNIRRSMVRQFTYGRFRLACFVMILLYNLTESAFKGLALMWLLFLLVALEYRAPAGAELLGVDAGDRHPQAEDAAERIA